MSNTVTLVTCSYRKRVSCFRSTSCTYTVLYGHEMEMASPTCRYHDYQTRVMRDHEMEDGSRDVQDLTTKRKPPKDSTSTSSVIWSQTVRHPFGLLTGVRRYVVIVKLPLMIYTYAAFHIQGSSFAVRPNYEVYTFCYVISYDMGTSILLRERLSGAGGVPIHKKQYILIMCRSITENKVRDRSKWNQVCTRIFVQVVSSLESVVGASYGAQRAQRRLIPFYAYYRCLWNPK